MTDKRPEKGKALGMGDAQRLAREERAATLKPLNDVRVTVSAELGRRQIGFRLITELAPGMIVALSSIADGPIDLRLNGKLIGKGLPVISNDRHGVRISEIVRGLDE